MPVPDLTDKGILPEGEFDVTLRDVADRFTYNETRKRIWDGFTNFSAKEGKFLAGLPVLLDGSFTTDEPNPRDIDIVVDLVGAAPELANRGIVMHLIQRQYFKQTYLVDFCVFDAAQFSSMRNWFKDMRTEFKVSRGLLPSSKKGLLRVTL